jgi:uncharacterized protein
MTRYNCLQCPGYCCSHARIAVSDFDIQRLARHFGVSEAEARERYTYRYRTAEVDEQILRHHQDHVYKSVCRFFDRELRTCTVYDARPERVPALSVRQSLRVLQFPEVRARASRR